MGMTLWIHTLEGRIMSKESDDHSILYELSEEIDAICASLGVTPLTAFFDMTDLELNFSDEEDEDEDDGEGEPEEDPETGCSYGIDDMKWFDATAGLNTFEAIRRAVSTGSLGSIDDATRTMLTEEIDDCISNLRGPASRGGKFNLPVIM